MKFPTIRFVWANPRCDAACIFCIDEDPSSSQIIVLCSLFAQRKRSKLRSMGRALFGTWKWIPIKVGLKAHTDLSWCAVVAPQVLAAFASVAENSEQDFVKYYDHIVPYLKQLLSQPPADKQDRMLRAKAMECVTLIGVCCCAPENSSLFLFLQNSTLRLLAPG